MQEAFGNGHVGVIFFFFSSRRRHTRFDCDWSSDVCSSDLGRAVPQWRGAAGGGGRTPCRSLVVRPSNVTGRHWSPGVEPPPREAQAIRGRVLDGASHSQPAVLEEGHAEILAPSPVIERVSLSSRWYPHLDRERR